MGPSDATYLLSGHEGGERKNSDSGTHLDGVDDYVDECE